MMDVADFGLMEFLRQPQQLTIPIYQRKYSWEDTQCKQLLNDIIEISKSNKEGHFVGSIVFQSHHGRFIKSVIIDGQQRITTMSLLIAALTKFILKNDFEEIEDSAKELAYDYLFNSTKSGNLRYKLVLTEDDNSTYRKILDNVLSDNDVKFFDSDAYRLKKSYEYFVKNIKKDNVVDIWNGLYKLYVVSIDLKGNNSPQSVFESLNSTGKDLAKSDLIRNFLLMDLKPEQQEIIYNSYWHDVDLLFEKTDAKFDEFIRNYLILRRGKVLQKDIYVAFKEEAKEFENIEELIKDVVRYSQYLANITLGKEKDLKLRQAFDNFNKLSYDTVHPFLLALYSDYEYNKISKEEFLEIVKLTESYTFRRNVCGLDSTYLRKIYAEMYSKINKENYVDSYKYILTNLSDLHRMPSDEEFESSLTNRNMYEFNNKKYFLETLENNSFKERTIVDEKIQIEHVMPQTLTPIWKEELGEDWANIHKEYIHSLGNLTLTGYNPELSNHSFSSKKEEFENSKFTLNKYFTKLEKWDKEEIIKRRDFLIGEAKKIWEYPSVSNEITEKYDIVEVEETNENVKKRYWTKLNQKAKDSSLNLIMEPSNEPYFFTLFDDMEMEKAHITMRMSNSWTHVKCDIYMYNKDLFFYLNNFKDELEENFDEPLEWIYKDNHQAIRSVNYINTKYEENWDKAIEWHIKISEKFNKIFLNKIREFYK